MQILSGTPSTALNDQPTAIIALVACHSPSSLLTTFDVTLGNFAFVISMKIFNADGKHVKSSSRSAARFAQDARPSSTPVINATKIFSIIRSRSGPRGGHPILQPVAIEEALRMMVSRRTWLWTLVEAPALYRSLTVLQSQVLLLLW